MNVPSSFDRIRRQRAGDPRQCVNSDGTAKQRHQKARHARAAMNNLRKAPDFREKPGYELNVFHCEVCHFWHVGNIPTTRKD